jgi:nitrite reductase/ring-hydroxylating ferredoxin subunit/uncharacterized membrane protein
MATAQDQSTGPAGPAWSPPAPERPRLHAFAQRLEGLEPLDAVAKPFARAVRRVFRPGPVRDALSGRALGHALHPLLTDVPIGTWTSAVILDLAGGPSARHASEQLIGVGIAAALPTAAAGVLDWADTEPADDEVRRVGVVHALANVTALTLFGASLSARRGGRFGRGRALALAGTGALGIGGHLGGHLSLGKGVGVAATSLGTTVADWADAGPAAELEEGAPVCREVDGTAVLLVRLDGAVRALADRCSHRGGPLHEGELDGLCITCPWHGSRFRLEDGSVERGPSPYPQPSFDVRECDGRIEIRAAHGSPTV